MPRLSQSWANKTNDVVLSLLTARCCSVECWSTTGMTSLVINTWCCSLSSFACVTLISKSYTILNVHDVSGQYSVIILHCMSRNQGLLPDSTLDIVSLFGGHGIFAKSWHKFINNYFPHISDYRRISFHFLLLRSSTPLIFTLFRCFNIERKDLKKISLNFKCFFPVNSKTDLSIPFTDFNTFTTIDSSYSSSVFFLSLIIYEI